MDIPTPAIGIDLGTTYSCVAYLKADREIVVLTNENGKHTTPSFVAFKNDRILVGDGAKSQASINPSNTIYDTKRLIGRKFEDPVVQHSVKNWPFKIVNMQDKPMIEVTYKGETKLLHAEEIQARILSKMKMVAEIGLDNEHVVDAVITVPAAFNDAQRQATIDAGTVANLNVLQIINEPTAAAIAYGYEREIGNGKYILVYDLGGGTFDVSILQIDNQEYRVKSSLGDLHLGGQDFDSRLLDKLTENMTDSRKRELKQDPKAISRLRRECEQAKIDLSSAQSTTIIIEDLLTDFDYEEIVTRTFFVSTCNDLFQKSIEIVEKCLVKAELVASQIDEIVLVGGSSRIPKIQSLLKNKFEGKSLKYSIHPEHAIAQGAAIHASMYRENRHAMVLIDVINNSLGVETVEGLMSTIIEKDMQIPCSNTRTYTTDKDNQVNVFIQVYEGERTKAVENRLLGKFIIPLITMGPKGVPKIDLNFTIDNNGILRLNAMEKSGIKLEIREERGRMPIEPLFNLK